LDREKFLKLVGLSISGLALNKINLNVLQAETDKKNKNWLWMHLWHNASDEEYKRRLDKVKRAGFDAIIPNVYAGRKAKYQSKHLPVSKPLLEKVLPIAASMDLEVHAWIWSMICNNPDIIRNHQDWFAVNRNGKSTIEKPAYVGYYRFMCPNNPGVRDFVAQTVRELSAYPELKGIHLDYIRFPDVILAKNLQKKYNLQQDREFPEFDYCYCENCRAKFKSATGREIMDTAIPDQNQDWRKFRFESITDLVNSRLIPEAKKTGKFISAAVFPNWEHVRQNWFSWNLDAAFPMLYHKYYDQDEQWIMDKIIRFRKTLDPDIGLYSGLFVDFFKSHELKSVMQNSTQWGADGVSLFAYHSLEDEHWEILLREKSDQN